MTEPMSDERLAGMRQRDAKRLQSNRVTSDAAWDRRVLLAEVDRLRAELAERDAKRGEPEPEYEDYCAACGGPCRDES